MCMSLSNHRKFHSNVQIFTFRGIPYHGSHPSVGTNLSRQKQPPNHVRVASSKLYLSRNINLRDKYKLHHNIPSTIWVSVLFLIVRIVMRIKILTSPCVVEKVPLCPQSWTALHPYIHCNIFIVNVHYHTIVFPILIYRFHTNLITMITFSGMY